MVPLILSSTSFFIYICHVYIGSECVSYLIEKGHAKTRADAVALGQALMDNNLLSHVTKDHRFKDEHLFYRFKV